MKWVCQPPSKKVMNNYRKTPSGQICVSSSPIGQIGSFGFNTVAKKNASFSNLTLHPLLSVTFLSENCLAEVYFWNCANCTAVGEI